MLARYQLKVELYQCWNFWALSNLGSLGPKNHTHVMKVGHTPEFPVGIYWWKNCWRYHQLTHVYQKFLRYTVKQNFLSFWAIFPFYLTLSLLPSPKTTQKTKILKKWKKHLEMTWCMLAQIWSATDIVFCHYRPFFALLPPD